METEEENSLSNHLLDHDYVRPVVYEDNPNKEFSEEDKEVFDVDDNREEIIVENDFNQVPETYRMIPGVRHGSKVYVDNLGFRYYMHEASTKSIYLVYEQQKNRGFEHCPCRALVSTDLVNNKIYIKDRYQHNHEPAVTNLDVPFFRGAISTRALDWENMYPEAAINYTCLQAQRRLKRMRRSRQPDNRRIPENIHELYEKLVQLEHSAYSNTLNTTIINCHHIPTT